MLIFSIRPMSYPNKYLSVNTDRPFFGGYYLTVAKTKDQKSISFTSTQSIINNEITETPSLHYNPGENSFLYFKPALDAYGALIAVAENSVEPSILSKLYINMINISTCYIYVHTANSDPAIDYPNTYVLSYHAAEDKVYFSKSPLYPNEKIWLIDIYPQHD
ncbi:hypothetical protein K1X45_01605 [Pseudochrobactrum sp. Wa41.01b-1]|uniref:hypothetical protein n=1 Tax=Pseudochrobactrum sp. Wa41.01b-1 TaxID=2864102 RepID=UPI001C68BD45|nr:hypothetical protein [Pseudochrobactrum sp. Wa41.01b-1]QYM73174.1 hypothetical protein K1X45_01605 [Pseudochrobactrum sp. Wa41.01b-1]